MPRQILLIICSLFPLALFSQDLINATALKNGVRIISSAPSYKVSSPHTAKIDDYSVQALLDETPVLWCSKQGSSFPLVFTFELSEDYNLEKLVFNNKNEKFPGISARDIKVEVSGTNAFAGYQNIGEFTLKENIVNTFSITPVKARWIKLTILSNYGNREYTELAEFEAWGKFSDLNYIETDIVGVWDTNFEWVSINSNKNGYIYGCYKWSRGELYSGEVNRRVFTFTWSQKDDGQKGWCRVVINKEGNRLCGIWGYNDNYSQFAFWEFSKNSSTPKSCWNDKAVESKQSTRIDVKPPKETLNLLLNILDRETNNPLPADIKVEMKGEQIASVKAGQNGSTELSLNKSYEYQIKVQAPSYMPQTFTFSFSEDQKNADLPVSKSIQLQRVETGKTIQLNNILFERGKFELLPESFSELDKLVDLMKANPAMEIELAGHTDNVGLPEKNVELSQNRVNEVKKYMIRNGIAANRIKSVGYGGSKPLFSNDQEETRKLNRRVEFKILKM